MADANGYSNGSKQPWWAEFFVKVGFPTALAIILVGALLGWIPSPIMRSLSRLEYYAWQQNRLMRTVCYSQAVNKRDCEPWREEAERERE